MKSFIGRLALTAVIAAAASVSDAAYFGASQSAQVYNSSAVRSYVRVYKAGSYGTPIASTPTYFGNYSYSTFHPYLKTNYEHWLYDYGKGNWDNVYTVKFTDK